jgi:hypothetical protein
MPPGLAHLSATRRPLFPDVELAINGRPVPDVEAAHLSQLVATSASQATLVPSKCLCDRHPSARHLDDVTYFRQASVIIISSDVALAIGIWQWRKSLQRNVGHVLRQGRILDSHWTPSAIGIHAGNGLLINGFATPKTHRRDRGVA